MFKEKLGRIVSSKAFYIIFSILASVALWMYIEISQNPDEKRDFENISIVFINEDVLRDKGLVVTSRDTEAIELTYEGKLGTFSKLNSSLITATVDLASITSAGWMSLPYKVVLPPDVERSVTLTSKSVERISIKVERVFEKTVEVKGRYDGGTASAEYIAGTPEFSPNTLTVIGPEEIVSKISTVWVPIMRTNLSATLTEELDFVLLDEDGNQLAEKLYDSLSYNPEINKIRVTVPVRMVKEVPLTVNFMYGAGATEQNTKVTITPAKITISGEPDIIRNYNSITLSTVDLTKLELKDTVMLPIVMENNFTNESGVTEALVTVEVLGSDVRRFQTENLSVVNKPTGYTATIIPQSLDVKIRGSEELLDALANSTANIRVVADLKDYRPGTSEIPAKVYIDGDFGDIGAVGEYKLAVRITKD